MWNRPIAGETVESDMQCGCWTQERPEVESSLGTRGQSSTKLGNDEQPPWRWIASPALTGQRCDVFYHSNIRPCPRPCRSTTCILHPFGLLLSLSVLRPVVRLAPPPATTATAAPPSPELCHNGLSRLCHLHSTAITDKNTQVYEIASTYPFISK